MNDQRKTQSVEESVNWISYNLKRIADVLENVYPDAVPAKKEYKKSYNDRRSGSDMPF